MGELERELSLNVLPGGKSIRTGDVFGVSIDADDAVVLEVVYVPVGDEPESRLDALYSELDPLLKMAKKEKERLQALADASGGKKRTVLFDNIYESSSSSVTDGSSTLTEDEDVIRTNKRHNKTKRKKKEKRD